MNPTTPRPEYPRPQCVRPDWLCLNGEWQFEIDSGDSGEERGLRERELAHRIMVPFCPESELSGIGYVDFMNVVWYRRVVSIPAAWRGRDVLLHFQACDYDTTVWVNGIQVGRHRGGFTPFTCDLRGVAEPGGEATIVVRARDLKDMIGKPAGKQASSFPNRGCHYTRTTGIWQTVWLEPVPRTYLQRPRVTPNLADGTLHITQPIGGNRAGLTLRARLLDEHGVVAAAAAPADRDFMPQLVLAIPAERLRLWSPADPFLYNLEIELCDTAGVVCDTIASYAGMRSVTLDGMAVKINGTTVFQRLVLDQGYYPDGILTAPTDDALRRDIELSMAAGFNGARLHQKVFEERFLYHADRLGYLVWAEFADWISFGTDMFNRPVYHATIITQWLEALHRDYSHPCIIGWCPLNESHDGFPGTITPLDDATRGMFLATKAMDQTRPVLDSSGYSHRVPEADIYDSHDYDQRPDAVRERHAGLAAGTPYVNLERGQPMSVPYRGQPYFVSEFGGIWWNPEAAADTPSWGYGERPKTIEEFYTRFEGLCHVLLENPAMFGYCYTQLTDVFQEQNGLYFFDRRPKFDVARLRAIQTRAAAIEQ